MTSIAYKAGYKYQLAEAYSVHVSIYPSETISTTFLRLMTNGVLWIGAGYAWDGRSGPTIDTPNFMRGSLVHDALYQLMRLGHLPLSNRERVDRLLQRICIEDGMWDLRAWWVYKGVATGGERAALPAAIKIVQRAP